MDKDHPNWKSGSGTIPKNVLHQVPETLETLKARVRKVISHQSSYQFFAFLVKIFEFIGYCLKLPISVFWLFQT
jgi:hypothetical protein